jgi:hypothetical protein
MLVYVSTSVSLHLCRYVSLCRVSAFFFIISLILLSVYLFCFIYLYCTYVFDFVVNWMFACVFVLCGQVHKKAVPKDG